MNRRRPTGNFSYHYTNWNQLILCMHGQWIIREIWFPLSTTICHEPKKTFIPFCENTFFIVTKQQFISFAFNSRFRSHNIDWCPFDPWHHRLAADFTGGRVLLVATQALAAGVRWTHRRERDEQRQLEVPAAPRKPATGTATSRTAKATTGAAGATSWPAKQYQQEAQWVP